MFYVNLGCVQPIFSVDTSFFSFFMALDMKLSRWWFQIFFIFHPYLGKIPILPNIFLMGWNHHDLFKQLQLPIVNLDWSMYFHCSSRQWGETACLFVFSCCCCCWPPKAVLFFGLAFVNVLGTAHFSWTLSRWWFGKAGVVILKGARIVSMLRFGVVSKFKTSEALNTSTSPDEYVRILVRIVPRIHPYQYK